MEKAGSVGFNLRQNLDSSFFMRLFSCNEVADINCKRRTNDPARQEGRAEVLQVSASESFQVGVCWRFRAYTMVEAIAAGWLIASG